MTLTLARLPPDQQRAVLSMAAVSLRHRKATEAAMPTWRDKARKSQLPPDEAWRIWYIRGGRGSGKTWVGANTLAEMALARPGEYGVVAPTFADMRDKCVEGDKSGLLAVMGTTLGQVQRHQSRFVDTWNRSTGELRLRNGSTIHGDGADDGAPTIQGFNLNALWADEVGLWKKWKMAWTESIRYAVRISPAQIVATGTPKRGHPLVKLLMEDPEVNRTLLRTSDNIENLDPEFVDSLYRQYAGTTLGRQELEGEILNEVPGALWNEALIDHAPVPLHFDGELNVPNVTRTVIGIDPAVTSGEDSDETGIVVVTLGYDGRAYVLDDVSGRYSPDEWAKKAVEAYAQYNADRIVAEVNNGGDLIESMLRLYGPNLPISKVHARVGKHTRAEPVAALYEQGRVSHVRGFPTLEDQMCAYTGNPGEDSPDRMDALVWALTDLVLGNGYVGSQFSMVA